MDSRNNEKKSSIPVEDYGETPPAYEAEAGPSTVTQLSISHSETRPTTESPFTFPINAPLPPYSASSSNRRPIAVPQAAPIPASPLLSAYPPALLHYGIPKKTWLSFLETISAFLTAKVSRRALNHAADMAKQVGDGPNRLFKNLVSHTKDVGKGIGHNAKQGNIIGAALGVIGGAVTIPVSAALGTVTTVASLPKSAISAAVKKPQTPRERAAVYLTVANKDWFQLRGLHAILLDTKELSQAVGSWMTSVIEATRNNKNGGAEGQLDALKEYIEELEIQTPEVIDLKDETLWLVLTQVDQDLEQ